MDSLPFYAPAWKFSNDLGFTDLLSPSPSRYFGSVCLLIIANASQCAHSPTLSVLWQCRSIRCIFTFALGQAANSLSSKCTQVFCLTPNMSHSHDASDHSLTHTLICHWFCVSQIGAHVTNEYSSFVLLYSHFHLSCQWAFSRNLHTLNCLPWTSLTLSKPLFLSFLFLFIYF